MRYLRDLLFVNALLLSFALIYGIAPEADLILGIMTVFFLSGYAPLHAIRSPEDLDQFARLSLIIGLSISETVLVGLLLNFSPWGVTPRGYLTVTSLISVISTFYVYKERKGSISRKNSNKNSLHDLNMKEVTVVIASIVLLAWIMAISPYIKPTIGGKYTEFYLLDHNGEIRDYPVIIFSGENVTLKLGIRNHEGVAINYTIDVWILNLPENLTTDEWNLTEIYHLDRISAFVPPMKGEAVGSWRSQWESILSYRLTREGRWLLVFILYKGTPPEIPKTHYTNYVGTWVEEEVKRALSGESLSLYMQIDVEAPIFKG